MSYWRCQECRGLLYVENDDMLMLAVLDHPCEPVARWRALLDWLRKRVSLGVNSY